MAEFKDFFSKQSDRYARYRPHYPQELFDYVASLPAERRLAWDCATGNGQAALGLAPYFEKILATDASQSQLANAQKHPKVEYRLSPAECCPLEDKSVDLVTVATAVHWFDHEKFYAEVRRVLKPSGAIAVWGYGNSQRQDPKIDAIVEHFFKEVIGPFWPPEMRYVWASYRNIPFPFREGKAPSFRLEAKWDLPHLLGYFYSWSATQRFIEARGHDPIRGLEAELIKVWGRPERKRKTTWDIYLRVGRLA